MWHYKATFPVNSILESICKHAHTHIHTHAHTRTHTHTYTHTHTHTHTNTHTHILTHIHTHTHTHTYTHTHTKFFSLSFFNSAFSIYLETKKLKVLFPPSLSFVHLETFMSSLHPHTCPFSFAILILALLSFFVPLFVL